MRLSEYLLDRIFSLICMLVSALLLFGLLWLIETPATFILFAETILMAAYISALVYDFFRKRSYYNLLLKMMEQMEEKSLLGELLTQPHFLEGQILVDILRRCNKYQNDQISNAKQASREYREYIDSWIHEIKNPITSARLMIENEKNPTTLRIDDELRKIDTYCGTGAILCPQYGCGKGFQGGKNHTAIFSSCCVKDIFQTSDPSRRKTSAE
jgi:signal transduction histidine kinase